MAFTGISVLAAPKDTDTLVKLSPSLLINRSITLRAPSFSGSLVANRSLVASGSTSLSAVARRNASHDLSEVMHTMSSRVTSLCRFPAASSVFSGEDSGVLFPMKSQGHRSLIQPRAHRYSPHGFRYPEITKKPVWWWRTLACIPYLLALQLSDAGYYLHPLANRYAFLENLIFYVPGACNRLPGWFSRCYHLVAYLLVVKNRKVPHFFRFHLVMGMLMEVALQILWVVSNSMPLIHYKGTFGVEYWGVIALAYIAVLLECVRCALLGQYAEIPFFNEAAYIHTLFGTDLKIGGMFI